MHKYSLTGAITNQDNLPVPTITVIAHDQDPKTPETQLGEAVITDGLGQYAITYKEEDFIIEGRESGGADIVIRVYDADGVLLVESERYEDTPKEAVIDLQITYELPALVEPVKVAPPSLSIKGTVVDRLGRSLKDAKVQLWEDGASRYSLESEVTDSSGAFELIVTGDLHGLAMDCTKFHFMVWCQKKIVANTQEQEPTITWDISHKEEERIELKANVTGKIKTALYSKEKAIAFSDIGNKTIQQIQEQKDTHWDEVVGMATEELDSRVQDVLGEDIDPALKDMVSGIDFSKCAGKKMPLKEYINTHIRQHNITQSQFDTLQNKWEATPLPTNFNELLPEDKTLQEIPFFQQILEEGQAHALADVIALPSQKTDHLLQAGWRVRDTDFRVLTALQEDKVLTQKQVIDLQQIMELNALFDQQIPLVKALKTAPVLGSRSKLKNLKDLVPLRASDWEKVIVDTKVTPPQELTAATYGKLLEKRVEKAFPSAVLLHRFVPAKVGSLKNDFKTLDKVLQQDPNLLKTKNWEGLDLTGMTKTEVVKIKTAYTNSLKQLNKYHGLDVHRMSDPDGDLDNHLNNTARKITLLDSFYKQNADKEILAFDLRPEADLKAQEIDFTGIEAEDQTLILRHLKTDQRLYGLTKDIEQAMLFKEQGFYSAQQTQAVSLPTLSRTLGLSAEALRYPFENALRSQLKTENWMASRHGIFDDFKDFKIGGVGLWAPNEKGEQANFENEVLRKYDGYQDFFGSLDYCDCQHCDSIFSPAAYFVDLMAWVEKMVLNDTFPDEEDPITGKNKKEHPLHLKNRRPDLWYLDLSCSNTNDRVPYLDLINEVLENYIFYVQKTNDSSATEFYEKTPFETIQSISKQRNEFVESLYQNIYNKPEISKSIYSIKAPFCLAHEELKIYLKHFPITLEEIANTLASNDESQLARTRLGLSGAEYKLLSKTAPYNAIGTLVALQHLFQFQINNLGRQISLDVKAVLKDLNISRGELTKLINTHFIGIFNISEFIEIKSIKEKIKPNDPDPIQNNAEKLLIQVNIINAENYSLDRIHRFTRLSKKVSWSLAELDLVLHQTGLPNDITEDKLKAVGKVLALQNRFNIPIDEVCVLFQQFPEIEDQNYYFQQLFNQKFNQLPFANMPSYPISDGTNDPENSMRFIHPVFEESNEASAKELPRLLAGLGVTDEEFFQLLSSPLQKELIYDDRDRGAIIYDHKKFKLSRKNLSLLYRHARLAEYLNLSIPQVFQLIGLQEEITGTSITNGNLEDLEKLVTFYNWWKTTDYSLDDLAYLKGKEILDKSYATPDTLTATIFNRIESETPFVFTDTVFAYLDGVTETQSKEIILSNLEPNNDLIIQATTKAYKIKENTDVSNFNGLESFKNQGAPAITKSLLKGLEFSETEIEELISLHLEALPNSNEYQLSAHYKETENLIIPAHIPVTQKQVKIALENYKVDYLLPFYLGQELGITTEKIKLLTTFLNIDLTDASYIQEIYTGVATAENTKKWIEKTHQLSVLFKSEVFTEAALVQLKDILAPLSLKPDSPLQQQIEQVNSLKSFIKEDTLEQLHAILAYGFNKVEQRFEDGKDAEQNVFEVYPDITTLLDVELTPVKLVNEESYLGTTPIVALEQLAKRIELSQFLGVGGHLLANLISDSYTDLAIARNALVSAFRLKYQDTATWEETITPFQDQIRGIKRDALTDYLINGLDRVSVGGTEQKRFPNKRELYKHFLMDTELEGCATTSKVVAATSSVQLFVQRVLLNLEVSEDFELKIEPDKSMQAQFTAQWEWRKNYRVWEANRKVFLYPENYIEPELRDNKTELFTELEEELLQREINAETVEEAYKKYMVGFEEVNNLQVAGAYHEKEIDGEGENIRPESSTDIIHLFAVTPGDENQLYYRKIENTYLSGLDDVKINWNSWEKVNLKVPVKKVSPIVYNGKLYLFWNEITTKPEFSNKTNRNNFLGYNHSIEIKYSSKKNKSWFLAKSIVHEKPLNLDIKINNKDLLNIEVLEKKIVLFDKLYLNSNSFLKRMELEINKVKKSESLTFIAPRVFNDPEFIVSRHYSIEFGLYNVNNQLAEYITSEFTYPHTSFKDILVTIEISEIIDKKNGNRELLKTVNGTFKATELSFDSDEHVIVFLKQLNFKIENLNMFGEDKGIYKKINYIIKKFTTWRVEYTNGEDIQIISYERTLNIKIPSKAFFPILDKSELTHKRSKSNYVFNNYLGNKPFLAKQSNELYVSTIDPININGFIKNEEPILINLLPTSITHNEDCWVINSEEYINTKIKYFTNRNRAFDLENIFQNSISYQQKNASVTNNLKYPYKDTLVNSDYHNVELILENVNEAVYFHEKAKSFDICLIRLIDKEVYFNLSYDLRNILNLSVQSKIITNNKNSDLEKIYGINKDYQKTNKLSFQNSSGVYFWELFFHIPFLIANHLNSQQKYKEAQQWYHYIFNPNAKPTDDNTTNYVWQFRAFNEHTIKSMREQLKNQASIGVYENDPFNPHGIARERISAYQKAVVMKYIDNLLDWGDNLFAQDTMDSINEATVLYTLGYEILGERPVPIGDCGEKKGEKTYQQIKQSQSFNDKGTTPILIEELEYTHNLSNRSVFNIQHQTNAYFINSNFRGDFSSTNSITNSYTAEDLQIQQPDLTGVFQLTPITTPVFCIPKNKELTAYWDRVEDRLFKIRNCMNIKGIKRELALFAPEIDPRLLLLAKAQGLSIQEALASLSGNLPPYRFPYLMAKAKEYVGLMQSFGGALQGALERKDVEQLTQLQATHQKNISNMSQYIRDQELEAADSSLETLIRRKLATENRKEYYKNLSSNGLSSGERAQISFKNTADGFYMTSLAMSTIAGVLGMIPNIVGMSNEVVPAFKALSIYSSYFKYFAELNNLKSSAAATNANFKRRQEGWKFQLNSTKDELNVIEEQIKGAEIRKAIAQRNYDIFEQSVTQQEDVFDFIKNKFSNLGLYTWLSSQLNGMYREAWNSAHTMAKMAERAYRFERSDDHTPLLNGNYWDANYGGLLAGQKLLIDLQNLERRYIETHHRKLEVDQSFSLMQINPQALLDLKQKGVCDFSIPELFFDLSYPGQYKRRMRSARLTIPCIVGPYVNVGATLTLTGSRIRIEPNPETSLKEMPPTRTTTIATSTAQNDSGVFEFSFRDERYMPFEGAGAISDWNIKLPNSFRPFDYNTINDVILHISYEADYDGVLADKVENENSTLQNSIRGVLKNEGLSRMFSLRQEFSDAYHQLLYQEESEVTIPIRRKHFPLFLQGFIDNITLVTEKAIAVSDIEMSTSTSDALITVNMDKSSLDDTVLYSATFTLNTANAEIKKEDIKDVLLYIEYRLT